MRILKTESFKNITALLRENYGNLHAQVAVKLSPATAAMFAKYTLQPSTGGAQWSVSMPGEDLLVPFSKASEMEQDQISMAIKRACSELKKAYPAIADRMVEVPDTDAIFFLSNGANVQVVLTQWGFKRVRSQGGTSIIRLCLDRAERLSKAQVRVRILNGDGSPAAGKEFTFLAFNNEYPYTTDENGVINVGHLKVGTQFRIETPEGKKSQAFTVNENTEFYDVHLESETTLTVRVEDKEGTGLYGIPTGFEDREQRTDGSGNAIYEHIRYEGPRVVSVSAEGFTPVEHTLVGEPQSNIVVFRRQEEQAEEPPLPPVSEPDPLPPVPEMPLQNDVRIRIVDKKGIPQANLPVKVLCQKGFEETVTDADGYITLHSGDLIPGEKPKIELMRPKATGKRANRKLTQQPPVPPAAPVPPSPDNTQPPLK